MKDRIKELTEKWYKLVSQGHHKDRDCHWRIVERWSYGEAPCYFIEHDGYVVDGIDIKCATYEEAQRKLISILEILLARWREL